MRKSEKPFRSIKLQLFWLISMSVLCVMSGCVSVEPEPQLSAKPAQQIEVVERDESEAVEVKPQAEPVVVDPEAVNLVCKLIYQGKFDEASEFIGQLGPQVESLPEPLVQLAEIVAEYNDISVGRQLANRVEYDKQFAKFNSYKTGEANDVNDINDVNSIPRILAAIAMVREYASEEQFEQILSDSFVQDVIGRAKDNADELEAKGKWLEAYIRCYEWLQLIYKGNKAYTDYSEKLATKAGILASFQDSPCETRQERYENIEKKLFIRAVRALNFSYVNIINYQEVAAKAIERCALLAEVLGNPYAEIDTKYEIDDEQISAWLGALGRLKTEAKESPLGVSRDKFIDIFERVLELNEQTVNLPSEVLIAQFTEAAFASLDPYTTMVWPRQRADFEKMLTNEFTGIGIEISKRKGLLTVISLLPDTPAYNSGLDAEDVIEKVDGSETKGMSLICAVKYITGSEGTDVTLTVRTPGQEQSREIIITRARIVVPTIRGRKRTDTGQWRHMVDEENKIGYIRITSFSDKTASDFEEVLSSLEQDGMRGLILDLRYNSGGLLTSAIEMTDKFVKRGAIVITRPRFGLPSYATAHAAGTHPDYPLVILINKYSASASEIMAGALADPKHRRAILVGERTHGKGSVQTITNYPGEGSQLKYTMAYYHLPSGQRVKSRVAMEKEGRDDWGVAPDVKVELRRDELVKINNIQKDNDVLVKADHDNGSDSLKKHAIADTLAVDHQMAVGVLVIRSKLIQAQASKMNLN